MSYKIILLLAVSVMTLLVNGSHVGSRTASTPVIEVSDANFTTFLAANKVILLKYYDPSE
jgi:hypothetical protein